MDNRLMNPFLRDSELKTSMVSPPPSPFELRHNDHASNEQDDETGVRHYGIHPFLVDLVGLEPPVIAAPRTMMRVRAGSSCTVRCMRVIHILHSPLCGVQTAAVGRCALRLHGGAPSSAPSRETNVRRRILEALGWAEDADDERTLHSLVEVQILSLMQAVKEMTGGTAPSADFILSSSISRIAHYVADVHTAAPTPLALFLFTGEGAHSTESDVAALRVSPSWGQLEECLQQLGVEREMLSFLEQNVGVHAAPYSPLVTTIINILNADRWRAIGHEPSIAIGHSIGEVAAAYVAGVLSMHESVQSALLLGQIGSRLTGGMLHTMLPRARIHDWTLSGELCVAAINSLVVDAEWPGEMCRVTLCGPLTSVDAWISSDAQAKRLPPPHPWHHPSYSTVADLDRTLAVLPIGVRRLHKVLPCHLISSTRAEAIERVDGDYWRDWLTKPGASNKQLSPD